MKRIGLIAMLMAGVMLLGGCPKKPSVNEPAAGTNVPANNGSDTGTTTTPLGGEAGATGAGIGAESGGINAKRVIYFDFDKSEIKPEFSELLSAHARNLTAHPNLKIKLEGNTDERGTREYNIGLGERRAQAVRRALLLQGVAESQITTVSFGAERPAAEGDDESAWALNRRVELVYTP